jgi:hypothetical protein
MDTRIEAKKPDCARPRPDETIIAYGLILRMPLERVPDLKNALASIMGTEIVYQKTSIRWLRIIEEDLLPGGGRK